MVLIRHRGDFNNIMDSTDFFLAEFREKTPTESDYDKMLRLIWEDFGEVVYAFIRSRVYNNEDAEDILQETFLRAIRAIRSQDHNKVVNINFRGWLFTIAKNIIRMRHRREEIYRRIAESGKIDSEQDGPKSPHIALTDIQDSFRKRQIFDLLRKCVEQLGETLKQILLLVDLEDSPPGKVAESLGIRAGTVRVRLHRARAGVRRCMESVTL
jgi:RNA polymerase sigma-70 factor (ECF subfamily)